MVVCVFLFVWYRKNEWARVRAMTKEKIHGAQHRNLKLEYPAISRTLPITRAHNDRYPDTRRNKATVLGGFRRVCFRKDLCIWGCNWSLIVGLNFSGYLTPSDTPMSPSFSALTKSNSKRTTQF